ncbi:iron hydrogenase small subunit [Clostridium sp. 19966]|uniref:ferredoxin hydrogenase n=1 Tax=Clostridium sp. 19966 TaxID=2768166 RepID=UPI0028DF2B60|nr:ferredoxin hydrogenase [Clostridium sp. 19966]MDT8717440.1 iron hydrogenase small subunit [Clostridium sp. 19966]
MANIIINGKEITVNSEETILTAARRNNIEISSLCFLKDCNDIGTCGVCAVEIEGKDEVVTACNTVAEDGMVISTDSEKVQNHVKERISNLLDKHEFKCGPCKRRENCEFLKLVIKHKAKASKPFIVADKTPYMDDRSKSLVMDRTKCVLCGRCVATCANKAGAHVLKFKEKDGVRYIGTEGDKCVDEINCLLCGQCIVSCPVDALSEKLHMERVKNALADEEKHVIVAMAPSVRTSLGELFNMGFGVDVTGKTYTALRMLGFDKIFDINFGADMTIMEEATELKQRIEKNGPFPMFTSCCPGWVRLAQNYYPEYLGNLSSAKSPQQIFGTASKTYYPSIAGIDPKKVFTVTVMPCTSKKFEADMEEMQTEDGLREIDAVITTRELAKMIKDAKINFATLEDSAADPAMGEYSGAGVIFGATGGVMEAALRSAKDFIENKDLKEVEYTAVRGLKGIKEASVEIAGNTYNVAVINGGANFFSFMNSGKLNEKQYHFIEVMACEGGCINGGGQPHVSAALREKVNFIAERASVLYNQDAHLPKRKSHENGAIQEMYNSYFGKPGEGLAHKLLHFKYTK